VPPSRASSRRILGRRLSVIEAIGGTLLFGARDPAGCGIFFVPLAGIAARGGHVRTAILVFVLGILIDLAIPTFAGTSLPSLSLVILRDPVVLTIMAGGFGAFWFLHRRDPDDER